MRKMQLGIDDTKLYFIVDGLAGIYIDNLLGKISIDQNELAVKVYEIITAIIGNQNN